MFEPSEAELSAYRSSLRVCGAVAIGYGLLPVAVGILFILVGVLGGIGVLDPSDTLEERLGGGFVGVAMGLVGILSGALSIVAGFGLRRVRPWARTVGLVSAVVDVIGGCGCVLSWGLCIWLIVVLVDSRAPWAFPKS